MATTTTKAKAAPAKPAEEKTKAITLLKTIQTKPGTELMLPGQYTVDLDFAES